MSDQPRLADTMRRGLELSPEFRKGLERHMDVEEEVLFPAFERLAGGSGDGPIRVMRLEHAELRRLMAQVADALARGAEGGQLTPLAVLTARIYAHNGKEERILYPATDRVVADGAREALVRRLEGFLLRVAAANGRGAYSR